MQAGGPPDLSRLAFVDVETTGFSCARDRITEIGVVTLDADGRLQEWGTLLNPRRQGWEETRLAAELGRGTRCELHVLTHWCYLGTARSEAEAHDILLHARPRFEAATYEFLRKVLPRLPRSRIVGLEPAGAAALTSR